MQPLTRERLDELLASQQAPCVSIYLPTRRTYPDLQQNAIQYRNLLRDADVALRQRYPGSAVRALMEPFHVLDSDEHFWSHRLDGLAVFGGASPLRRFDLQRTVPPLAVVADSFHVKPLLRQLRSHDRYQVLCVTRNRVRLFEGDRDHLDEVDPDGLVEAVADAIQSSQVQQQLTAVGAASNQIATAIGHSGAKRLAANPDTSHDPDQPADRFFTAVDRAVWERHSRPSGLPLVLAALPENEAIFRRVSHNQHLLPQGVEIDPEALQPQQGWQQLREAAWRVIEPRHEERMRQYLESFAVAKSRGKGSEDLDEVARAAFVGRVGTLLLDADRRMPGRLDPDDGHPVRGDGQGVIDDVFDDLGELALRRDATVLVVGHDRMPTNTGVAAGFRY